MRTIPESRDDQLLRRFGYRQQFLRTLRPFESFAVVFSFISITMALFTTFGYVLVTSGPRGIWAWPIAVVGQGMVALIYAALAAKIPLAGSSYQWAARLANPTVGWWLGWLSFASLAVLTVAADYAFIQLALQPMLGIEYTPLGAAVQTFIVIAVQATLIIGSTFLTTRINNAAVVFEVVGMVELSIVLLAAVLLAGQGDWSNLWSTGTVPEAGWFSWLGPFMLATLLGSYTLLGLDSAANMAEETEDPRRVVPRATLRAVATAGGIGMVFLITLAVAVGDVGATTADSAPVAFILQDVLGTSIEKVFLFFICVSMFCCGLIIMTTHTRLTWAMARDRRLPGHQLLTRVPKATGGPTGATILVALVTAAPLVVVGSNTQALVDMFTAATLLPAIAYAGTVLLYATVGRHLKRDPGFFHLGRWERPVVAGALIWLAFEFVVLLGPDRFRAAQLYAAAAIVLGLLVFGLVWMLEPRAMRVQVGAVGEAALEVDEEAKEPVTDERPRHEATFPDPHEPSEDSHRAYLRG
jgi:amino acid transporter